MKYRILRFGPARHGRTQSTPPIAIGVITAQTVVTATWRSCIFISKAMRSLSMVK